MFNVEEIAQAVLAGQEEKVRDLVEKGISEKTEPAVIINRGLVAGMDVVGQKFKYGEMFVPEVLMSARAMHAGLDILKPLVTDGSLTAGGTVVLGTVKGDLHDIGKNLVGMMLEAGGFNVVNLGIDIPPEAFVEAAARYDAGIIAMSALLTTTMLMMKETIEVLEEDGVRDKYKVIVGGAPVTQEYADEIKADGFAPDAASAVELCRRLLK